MSDSLRPRGLQPTRLLCPWDFPGKCTGVGCHCLLPNNAITEIKNTLEATNSRITGAEDRISEVEDRTVEINEAERKKEQRIKRNEDNLRELQDNIKCPNTQIIGVPEEEDKKTMKKYLRR